MGTLVTVGITLVTCSTQFERRCSNLISLVAPFRPTTAQWAARTNGRPATPGGKHHSGVVSMVAREPAMVILAQLWVRITRALLTVGLSLGTSRGSVQPARNNWQLHEQYGQMSLYR